MLDWSIHLLFLNQITLRTGTSPSYPHLGGLKRSKRTREKIRQQSYKPHFSGMRYYPPPRKLWLKQSGPILSIKPNEFTREWGMWVTLRERELSGAKVTWNQRDHLATTLNLHHGVTVSFPWYCPDPPPAGLYCHTFYLMNLPFLHYGCTVLSCLS